MTSPTSAPSRLDHRANGRFRLGFTLTELLVVIGIIILLAGILIPVVLRATKQATSTRLAADLQAIDTALTAYKTDFGDYPRPDRSAFPGTAATVLAKALMATGPATDTAYSATANYKRGDVVSLAGSPATHWICVANDVIGVSPTAATPEWSQIPFSYADGANGPGLRLRSGVGQVKGPYLNIDRFRVGSAGRIMDGYGQPILYFVASANRPNISANPDAAVSRRFRFPDTASVSLTPRPNYVDTTGSPLYRADDNGSTSDTINFWSFPPNSMFVDNDRRYLIQYRLEQAGDYTGPYLLWSAGPNQFFFDADDVTNFNK